MEKMRWVLLVSKNFKNISSYKIICFQKLSEVRRLRRAGRFAVSINGFAISVSGFVISVSGFVISISRFAIYISGFVISMSRFGVFLTTKNTEDT
jgi:hypothetical protein